MFTVYRNSHDILIKLEQIVRDHQRVTRVQLDPHASFTVLQIASSD